METQVPQHLIVADLQEVLVEIFSQFLSSLVGQTDISHQLQVMVQDGGRGSGGTDGDVGEHQVRDGFDGNGGAGGTLSPPTEWHPYEEAGHAEPRRDDQDPEESPELFRCRDVSQAVDGGGGQEVVQFLHHSDSQGQYRMYKFGLSWI